MTQGTRFRVQEPGFIAEGARTRVQGLGCRGKYSGFGVQGPGAGIRMHLLSRGIPPLVFWGWVGAGQASAF